MFVSSLIATVMFVMPAASSPATQTSTPPTPPSRVHLLEAEVNPAWRAMGNVESYTPYVPQTVCDPGWRRGVEQFKNLILSVYPETSDWGSARLCAYDGVSEHLDGRAWDWKVNAKNSDEKQYAMDVLDWLVGEGGPSSEEGYWAKRLGVMYIGFNKKIWGSYRANEGWRKLPKTDPHRDHVHFSFSWNGAEGKTSFWRGEVSEENYGPCRLPGGYPGVLPSRSVNPRPCPPQTTNIVGNSPKLLWLGTENRKVSRLQQAWGLPATGVFDYPTRDRVLDYQEREGEPRTGYFTVAEWRNVVKGR